MLPVAVVVVLVVMTLVTLVALLAAPVVVLSPVARSRTKKHLWQLMPANKQSHL
jgi:hypothetical protein